MSGLRFPSVKHPLVSIVMVTRGGWQLAEQALETLRAHTDPCYEVIVVDNASEDGTADRLRTEVAGIKLILNEGNAGFGPATNQGAAEAKGRFLCLLNSDAFVQPGWLPPLLEILEGDTLVGAAVPMLLNRDGSLQEAGSLVDPLGRGQAYGDGDDASKFAYRFRRDVDYGSAACMLIRKSSFDAVGGLDPTYPVGYFEDVDLCFSLRERGLCTVYEPRSRVVHVRFGSFDSDTAARLMQDNRIVFARRWGHALGQRPHLPIDWTNPRHLVTVRDAEALDRVLVIDDRVPHSDRGSGDPRMARLVSELAWLWPHGRVTLFASSDASADRYAPPLLARGVEVASAPDDPTSWFQERRFHYSVVIVSRPENARVFAPILRLTQPQALRIYDAEALFYRRMQQSAGAVESRGEVMQMRETEREALRTADAIFCVSEEERAAIDTLTPGKPSFLLPGFVDLLEAPAGFAERRDLVFFGGFLAGPGSPNEDAVVHLVETVLPLVWASEPELVLHVVGADPTPAVRALDGPRVNVVGYVEDPFEWLDRCRVHVSPMRFGAGIKLKLLDSMAAGLPFVTTTQGAEGLQLGETYPLVVADEPEQIAGTVQALYTQRDLWQRVHDGLLSTAREWFSRERFVRTLVEAMSELGIAPPPSQRDRLRST